MANQAPSDSGAWQPVLDSNGRGAWRHNLERPLQWDRLTLLRRVGHATEAFSDSELIRLGEVSGVSDDALRKMHVDHAPPPPELSEAMRLFKADRRRRALSNNCAGRRPLTRCRCMRCRWSPKCRAGRPNGR